MKGCVTASPSPCVEGLGACHAVLQHDVQHDEGHDGPAHRAHVARLLHELDRLLKGLGGLVVLLGSGLENENT